MTSTNVFQVPSGSPAKSCNEAENTFHLPDRYEGLEEGPASCARGGEFHRAGDVLQVLCRLPVEFGRVTRSRSLKPRSRVGENARSKKQL